MEADRDADGVISRPELVAFIFRTIENAKTNEKEDIDQDVTIEDVLRSYGLLDAAGGQKEIGGVDSAGTEGEVAGMDDGIKIEV
jgi:hypothetical protein